MGKFIKWLIGWPWCRHKWNIIERQNVFMQGHEQPVRVDYILQCEKCGDIKKRRT